MCGTVLSGTEGVLKGYVNGRASPDENFRGLGKKKDSSEVSNRKKQILPYTRKAG